MTDGWAGCNAATLQSLLVGLCNQRSEYVEGPRCPTTPFLPDQTKPPMVRQAWLMKRLSE
jgi:hypothetical protein